MSISQTLFAQLFHMKVICTAFVYLQFRFAIFCQKKIGTKAAHKMLMKLTTDGGDGLDLVIFIILVFP